MKRACVIILTMLENEFGNFYMPPVFERPQVQSAINNMFIINEFVRSRAAGLITTYPVDDDSGLVVVKYPNIKSIQGIKFDCLSVVDLEGNYQGITIRSISKDPSSKQQTVEGFNLHRLPESSTERWTGKGIVKVEGTNTLSKPYPAELIPDLTVNRLEKYFYTLIGTMSRSSFSAS